MMQHVSGNRFQNSGATFVVNPSSFGAPPGNSHHQQGDQLKSAESTHLTISDDRTNQLSIDKRNLSALCSQDKAEAEDYERHLMLLEQQNKRRLMIARQEQDNEERERQTKEKPGLREDKETDHLDRSRFDEMSLSDMSDDNIPTVFPNSNTIIHSSNLFPPDTNNNRLSTEEVQALRDQMALLEAKLSQFKSANDTMSPSRFQFLYRLGHVAQQEDGNGASGEQAYKPASSQSRIFSDSPEFAYDQDGGVHLRCNLPLRDLDLFLAQQRDISFIVFRDFKRYYPPGYFGTGDMGQTPAPSSESIYPVATGLKKALALLFRETPAFRDIQDRYELTGEIYAPYHFLYHSRKRLDKVTRKLVNSAKKQLDLLLQYVERDFGDEYAIVDSLLEENMITPEYLNYLFKPGDIIVEAKGKNYTGYVADSWVIDVHGDFNPENPQESEILNPLLAPPSEQTRHNGLKMAHLMLRRANDGKPAPETIPYLRAWTLDFDGQFFRSNHALKLEIQPGKALKTKNRLVEAKGPIPISGLNVFPLEYAPESVFHLLKQRGSIFWKCRTRRLVSYQGERSGQGVDMADERYIIDMESYNKLHSNNIMTIAPQRKNHQRISAESINDPDGEYQFLLPPYIKGYNLRHKKWFEISADGISDVKWNREAFQSLVIERKSKELIQALVTSQIEAEKGTDLISGKGNGLILLLHGGPGTGKTLTAESVAEIAEKPLYRVTCGDVGTKAEQVEKYLESVLYLGRIWGCVVLLDEADVFLEQRSLEDLERNALVSVFLRVLEYYDGILVLTSNRVGTFDEAFRSRIQLALHYPSLGPQQRFRIWQTFIDRLSKLSTDEEIDIDDLRDHLHLLKDEKMNGRQIRNVITTARQYAKWKKEPLTYSYLKDVIEVSGRFDGYLDKLHGGFSNDEIAQDDGLRLA